MTHYLDCTALEIGIYGSMASIASVNSSGLCNVRFSIMRSVERSQEATKGFWKPRADL